MKTIYIEIDAYKLLLREKRERNESFSSVIRRLFAERPALTAGELLDVMHAFEGKGAGRRRLRRTGREFVRPPDASSRPR